MSKICPECKVKYEDTQSFCSACGSKLIDKLNNEGLGKLIDISGDAAAVRADIKIDQSKTIVERQKSEKEIELDALNQLRNKATEFMQQFGRIDSDAKRQLNSLARQLGIGMEELRQVIQEAMTNRDESDAGLSMANSRYLQQAQQALCNNDVKTFKGLMPRLEAMAAMSTDDNVQYLYHLLTAITSPTQSIQLYEKQTDENYWRTFWAIISHMRKGDYSTADGLLARLNPMRFEKTKDDQNVLEALSNLLKGDNDTAEQFLCEIFEPSQQIMSLWRAIEAIIYKEEMEELETRFYLQHVLATPEQLYAQAKNAGGANRISLLLVAAEAGNAEAMCDLADCYYKGEDVEENLSLVVTWLNRAVDEGSSDAMNKLGCCYLNGNGVEKDQEKAFELLEQAADAGHLDGMVNLGLCYRDGIGVEENSDYAVELWEQAAEAGNTASMCHLAHYYYWTLGVKCENDDLACEWWEKAARAGSIDAMDIIAERYYWGNGVRLDRNKAINWWIKAAEAGADECLCKIARHYNAENSKDRAIEWWQKAVEKGLPEAIYALARERHLCENADENQQIAITRLREMADNGSEEAISKLAFCYSEGWGVEKNPIQAANLWQKAADKKSNEALCKLAECYYNGVGVDKNETLAIELWKEAETKGHAEPHCRLAEYYKNNGQSRKYIDQCYYAAKIGNADAALNLGDCYNGRNVGLGFFDKELAVIWWSKAAELDNIDAMYRLAKHYETYGYKNEKLNQKWLSKAQEKEESTGSPEALLKLADMYRWEKDGAQRNDDLATEYYLKAAELGSEEAMDYLYTEGRDLLYKTDIKAVKILTKCAELGSLKAMELFNRKLLDNGLCKVDEVLKWCEKGVKAGSKECLEEMSDIARYCWYDGNEKGLAVEIWIKNYELGYESAKDWLENVYNEVDNEQKEKIKSVISPSTNSCSSPADAKYLDLIKGGGMLRAIKLYMDEYKCDIFEAKKYLDALKNTLTSCQSTSEEKNDKPNDISNNIIESSDNLKEKTEEEEVEEEVVEIPDAKDTSDEEDISNSEDSKYLDLIKGGQKLIAIKLYIEDKGCGLMEAKRYLDALENEFQSNQRREMEQAKAAASAGTSDGSSPTSNIDAVWFTTDGKDKICIHCSVSAQNLGRNDNLRIKYEMEPETRPVAKAKEPIGYDDYDDLRKGKSSQDDFVFEIDKKDLHLDGIYQKDYQFSVCMELYCLENGKTSACKLLDTKEKTLSFYYKRNVFSKDKIEIK